MTLKYRLVSDLHLEFADIDIPVLPDEDKMVLVLAGDIANASYAETYVDFITEMCDRHDTVIWLMGNHEYYKNYIEEAMDEIKGNFVPRPSNLHILESGCIVVQDVAFICATLWTDYNKENPVSMLQSRQFMNDHNLIYKYAFCSPASPYGGYKPKFLPEDALAIHKEHKKDIFEHASELDIRAKVLVTHHGFSFQSIGEEYKDEHHLNGAFVSEMGYPILEAGFDYAHHGHCHSSSNYEIGNTKVITNPRGYAKKNSHTGLIENENKAFNPSLVIEV